MGTIDTTGLYTAPATLPAPNTVTVTAATVTGPSQSGTASLTIVNPAPVVSSISPATVNAGSGNTTLTVTGTGFCAQSVVELGGTALPTLYVNPTAVDGGGPAAQLANAGSLAVAVTTPAPGGGTSSAADAGGARGGGGESPGADGDGGAGAAIHGRRDGEYKPGGYVVGEWGGGRERDGGDD